MRPAGTEILTDLLEGIRAHGHDGVARDGDGAAGMLGETLIHGQDEGVGEEQIAGGGHRMTIDQGPRS